MSKSIDRAYRVGATDFVAKPISCPVLPHRLRYILRAYHLAEAQRIAGFGAVRSMPKNRRIECSPEVTHMLGMRSTTGMHSARGLFRHVLPTDRPMLIRAVRNALHGATIELDHRVVTLLGEVRTLSLKCEIVGAEGAPKYLQGSLSRHYRAQTGRERAEGSARRSADPLALRRRHSSRA